MIFHFVALSQFLTLILYYLCSVKFSFIEQNNQQQKISIRFFNDKEVRAAWDYDRNRWLFSVVDVIAVFTDSKNPRNYWKVMKYRLAKNGNELVTRCNQLKLVASDGKRYLTDCLPQNEMLSLVEAVPSQHAITFAKWLITGEDQIDSKSRDSSQTTTNGPHPQLNAI